ncbi:periplasmic heavy metal sensor [Maricaulis sp.]|uniref:periplasmic heavy metal sensor n=1 Tax=Maricaulis sp. TaxID=1486257 RepID=UPI0026330881|nr:periplasmic heavy metal sensor [Maricaulis sp.]
MKPSTPWIIALLASVLINGVLAGFVLHRTADGPDWRPHHEDGPGSHRHRRGGRGFEMREFVFALPEDARREVRERLRANMDEVRGLFRESRAAREELETLLTAQTVDREAVAHALQRMRDARTQLENGMEAVVLDILVELDADTRAAALEALHGDRGPRFRRHRPPPVEGPGLEEGRPEPR